MGVAPELGFGCHADRDVALSRALTEAAQARLTVISGARDDIGAGGYRDSGLLRQHRAARGWLRRRVCGIIARSRPWPAIRWPSTSMRRWPAWRGPGSAR